MKRNWDTIREILNRLEEASESDDYLQLHSFPEDRAAEVSYHVELLLEAGLVDGEMSKTIGPGPYDFFAARLTWSGHEFLDTIRSNTVWEKTKKSIRSKGLSLTFDLIKSVATEAASAILKSATTVG
jgi:Hypothetical protein (DUF2513)